MYELFRFTYSTCCTSLGVKSWCHAPWLYTFNLHLMLARSTPIPVQRATIRLFPMLISLRISLNESVSAGKTLRGDGCETAFSSRVGSSKFQSFYHTLSKIISGKWWTIGNSRNSSINTADCFETCCAEGNLTVKFSSLQGTCHKMTWVRVKARCKTNPGKIEACAALCHWNYRGRPNDCMCLHEWDLMLYYFRSMMP